MTTEQRISDLEQRLERYHYALAEAIQQRDRLALDAAWGVHLVLYSFAGAGTFFYLSKVYFANLGWLAQTLLGIAFFAAMGAISIWSNNARMKEVERLSKLPEWQRRWLDEYGADD